LTETASWQEVARIRERTLAFYYAAAILMLFGLGVLTVYVLRLGNLTGPGVEQSFGLAVALMFLMSALMIHLVDRMYRLWPLGRRVQSPDPGPVTDENWATFLAVAVLVAAGAAIAYIIGGLLV
jgi:hypothetical protein